MQYVQLDALCMASVKRIDARTGGKESTRPAKEKITRQLMLLLLTRRSSDALNSILLDAAEQIMCYSSEEFCQSVPIEVC